MKGYVLFFSLKKCKMYIKRENCIERRNSSIALDSDEGGEECAGGLTFCDGSCKHIHMCGKS